MKFALILAFVFLVGSVKGATSGVSENSLPPIAVLDKIKDIVDEAVKYTKEILENILLKEREILEKAKTIANSKVKESLEKIFNLTKKIKDLSKIGTIAENCVQQHSEQIDEIKDQVNSEIEKCTEAFKEGMIPVEREIWQTYMLLYKTIREMYDVIEECIFENQNNTIQQTMCIVKKINFFKDQVNEAHRLLTSSLERLEEMIPKVLEEYAECVLNAEINGIKSLEGVMYSVKNCIKESVLN